MFARAASGRQAFDSDRDIALQEGTGRCEAFSDGIFAIAATLLVLELRLPNAEGNLRDGLVALWPSYLAFALSFFVILVTTAAPSSWAVSP